MRVKEMATWGRRKAVFLVVLIFSILLLGFSFYHFTKRNQWLEKAFKKSPQGFNEVNTSDNKWAYSGTAIAVFLIICIFVLLLKEIRVRRKIVEELRMQKEHYRITISSMGEGLITTGKEGEIIYMNPAAEKLTGWTIKEAANLPLEKVYNVVNEESGKPFEHIVSRILKKAHKIEFENNTLLYTKCDNVRVISNTGSPLFDVRGNMSGTVLVFNDITEKKKTEAELIESEKQYRALIENLPEAVFTCDIDGYIVLYNKAAIGLLGREPVAGKDKWSHSLKIFNTDGTELLLEDHPMSIALKEEKKFDGQEIIIERTNGIRRHVLPSASPLFDATGKFTGAINMLIDITEKKEKEILIKQSEEKYRTLIEEASDAIFISDSHTNILEVNNTASQMLGFSNEELSAMNFKALYPEAELLNKPFQYGALQNGERIRIERNIIHRNGRLIPVEITAKLLSDGRFISIIRDISERKKAEKEIRDYQFALDVSSIVDISDENGIIQHANKNFCEISKYKKEELIGKDHKILNSGCHTQAFIQKMWDTIQKGKVWRDEIKNRAKDGSYYWVDTTIVPLLNADGKPFQYITIRTDITKRKASESFVTGVLNALTAHIAVINGAGTIIKTNTAWNSAALDNGVIITKGANYFDAYKTGRPAQDDIIRKTKAGIKKVLSGAVAEFYQEYARYIKQEEKWFYMRIMKFESTETLLVIENHDISERKKAELKSLKAVEQYDILAKATSDTIWDWDIASNTMLYNSGITNMFGYKISQVGDVFNWWKANIHHDDLDIVMEKYWTCVEKVTHNIQLEYRFRCSDGSYKNIYDRAFVMYGADQKPIRMIGAMQDVTSAKEEEKRIAKAIIDAQEKERYYIGQELHDNVNQILSCSLLTIGMTKDYLHNNNKMVELIGLTKEYTLSAINEIRKMSHELAPASFNDNTIKDIFEALLTRINLNQQFNIQFHFDDSISQVIGEDIQINLYRILQEQVKNILKYADADIIEIAVTRTDNVITMRTFDNGLGFDLTNVKKGIGLSNMKKRAESFAGRLIVNTHPGKGCEIIIEIPFHARKTVL